MKLQNGTQTVAAHGTRVALASAHTAAAWVMVQPNANNTGKIYLGGDNVSSSNGIELLPGDVGKTDQPMPPLTASTKEPLDLTQIYIDSEVDNEGVRFLFGGV